MTSVRPEPDPRAFLQGLMDPRLIQRLRSGTDVTTRPQHGLGHMLERGMIAPADATAVRQEPAPSLTPPQLSDFDPSWFATLLHELQTRPVQGAIKGVAAGVLPEVNIPLPVGGGERTNKTPKERLMFELSLARDDLRGEMFDAAVRRYLAQQDAPDTPWGSALPKEE